MCSLVIIYIREVYAYPQKMYANKFVMYTMYGVCGKVKISINGNSFNICYSDKNIYVRFWRFKECLKVKVVVLEKLGRKPCYQK